MFIGVSRVVLDFICWTKKYTIPYGTERLYYPGVGTFPGWGMFPYSIKSFRVKACVKQIIIMLHVLLNVTHGGTNPCIEDPIPRKKHRFTYITYAMMFLRGQATATWQNTIPDHVHDLHTQSY